jgi:hypothetical protein
VEKKHRREKFRINIYKKKKDSFYMCVALADAIFVFRKPD